VPRTISVALAGCGVVGGELLRLLRENTNSIEAKHGVRFDVTSVLVRCSERTRPVELAPGAIVTDVDSFLGAEADVVVEALGGIEPAGSIARATLARGARFVTANKALIAVHGAELQRLALRHAARLDFEAAVGGGVPIVRVLRESLADTPVRGIRGILNGTSNFILTRMEMGLSFDGALREARERGFAEADPARDLDGRDAADKIAILAWLAYGIDPTVVRARRRGILPDPEHLTADAGALGGRLRLLAECAQTSDGVTACVEPVIFLPNSEFGRTVGVQNRVVIDCGWGEPIGLSGPGAGGGPTASALLADVIRGARQLPDRAGTPVASASDETPHRWSISLDQGVPANLVPAIAARAGVVLEAARDRGSRLHIVTRRVAWRRIDLMVRTLKSRGGRPGVARLELEDSC
jgi:homoserine dehydrogenase